VSLSRIFSIPLALLLALAVTVPVSAQENSGGHVSPMLINVQLGEEQPLQLLDARGNELASSGWSVDNSELADIRQESGHVVLHPKAAGVLHVVALLEGATLTEEIKIWSLEPRMRIAGPHWVVPSTGRELAALQAAPTADGPDIFTLDQNDKGTYVRAFTNRGLQMWMWDLPETGGAVELVCGDNMGGAILTVTRSNFYTLYVVDKDGKLRWHHRFEGIRKGYALNASNLLHLLNQSVDGTSTTVSAWDGSTGTEKFELKVPSSHEYQVNVRESGSELICAPGRNVSRPLHTDTSGLFVNTDGDAYTTFSQKHWTFGSDKCTAGSVVDPQKVYFSRDDQLVLWRIQADGSHRDTIVDASKQSRLSLVTPMIVVSPTGDIIPDGFGGVLFSIRSTSKATTQKTEALFDDFVYRVTEDGELAYKFLLPRYAGHLHDEMVLGEQELGFATRGGMLIAFNVRDGSEVWRWNSGIPDVKVNMATAGGGCVVDTPVGLVLVEEGVKKQVVAPRGSDMYTPGLFIQDDPHGLAMLGAGIIPD
jgi:outer membrane protein assembly factor BamB